MYYTVRDLANPICPVSSMEKNIVLIPTYNELENVRAVSEAVFAAAPGVHILFIDDNSPDGTGKLLDEMTAENPKVHVLHRPGKQGLGRAYLAGFAWVLDHEFEKVVTMDADLSHDPEAVPALFAKAEEADIVAGSRYVDGIRIINWPLNRLLLSKGASYYVAILTGLPFSDPTGGFNCYRRELLESLNLEGIRSNGYSFQIEMKHTSWMEGFKLGEVPIIFTERRSGASKMDSAIVREALLVVWRLVIRRGFRRRPRRAVHSKSVAATA